MKRETGIAKRKARAVESFNSAAQAIGPITRGMHVFTLTRGQWSLIDAILYCLDQAGRSRLSVWTWSIAHYDVQCVERLMMDKRISSATLIVHEASRRKNLELLQEWQRVFGPESIKLVVSHAKLMTIESESGLKLLGRGSMNLNNNPRFEQFDLSEGGDQGFDLVRRVEDELPILPFDCTPNEAYVASKVGKEFGGASLNLFEVKKTWAAR